MVRAARLQTHILDKDGRAGTAPIPAQKLVVVYVVQLQPSVNGWADTRNREQRNRDVPASVHVGKRPAHRCVTADLQLLGGLAHTGAGS